MPTSESLSDESTVARSVRPTGLKHRSIILMIVLTVVTFGLYYPIWFLRRRAAFNGLDSPRKLQRWPFLLFLVIVGLKFILSIASGSGSLGQTIGAGAALLLNLIHLAVGILIVVQCFVIKDILEDHLAGPEDNISSSILSHAVKLSALMTLFFHIFYLQHVINRYIAGSQPKPV